MDRFEKVLNRLANWGVGLGGAFLVAIMLVVVTTVVTRLFKIGFTGGIEMVEVFIVVTVAFALPYTALKKGHVMIDAITSHLKPRTRAIILCFTMFLATVIWGFITWASVLIAQEKMFTELSYFMKIPYLPFRVIWIVGLTLFTLMYVLDFAKSIKSVVTKTWIQ
jgi:TRAP-type C4-dicarboxylate transport system permease small subunit